MVRGVKLIVHETYQGKRKSEDVLMMSRKYPERHADRKRNLRQYHIRQKLQAMIITTMCMVLNFKIGITIFTFGMAKKE